MASHLRSALVGAAAFLVSLGALAKPPAYTVTDVPFATSLHGVDDRSQDAATRGLVVARGESKVKEVAIDIVVREHRDQKNVDADGLLALSQRLARELPSAQEIRVVAGAAQSTRALEQVLVTDACTRTIVARVLVALDDKVVEIETRATPDPGTDEAKRALAAMSTILHGVRIRRLGSAVSLDPAKAPPAAESVAVPKPADGC